MLEYSPEARLLEYKTQARQVAQDICRDANVLEESPNGMVRL